MPSTTLNARTVASSSLATPASAGPVSTKRALAGRTLMAVAALLLCLDACIQLTKIASLVAALVRLGLTIGIEGLGTHRVLCLVEQVSPLTSRLGAIMMSGHAGGATAISACVGAPLVSDALFPSYLALVLGAALLRAAAQDPATTS